MRVLISAILLIGSVLHAEGLKGSQIEVNILNATTNTDQVQFKDAQSQEYLNNEQKKKEEVEVHTVDIEAFKQAIILNNINKAIKEDPQAKYNVQSNETFYAKTDNMLKLKEELRKNQIAELKEAQNEKSLKLIKADCIAHNNINVSLKDFMKLDCRDSSTNSIIEIYGSYVGDTKNFSLLGKIDYFLRDGKVYQVENNTYMTNEAETSFNLATTVNTRDIEKINIALAKNISRSVANEGNSILQDMKNANQNQSIATDQNGNVATATTNTKPTSGEIAERAFYAVVVGALESISSVSDDLKEKLPYLYTVDKGSYVKTNIFYKE